MFGGGSRADPLVSHLTDEVQYLRQQLERKEQQLESLRKEFLTVVNEQARARVEFYNARQAAIQERLARAGKEPEQPERGPGEPPPWVASLYADGHVEPPPVEEQALADTEAVPMEAELAAVERSRGEHE